MVTLLLSATGACSAYDPSLIEGKTTATRPVLSPQDGGPSSPDAARDAGRDAGATPNDDDDASVGNSPIARPDQCGDGRVSGEELCDTGIDEGQPGACPGEVCQPLSTCGLRARRGSGCQAACVLLPEACVDNDRCCPGMCTDDNDNDCSQSCGDGMVQPDRETCEDGSDTPCPTLADCDDGMNCTEDVLLGSAANCNAECANNPITTLVGGDSCCPEGANANTDPDCIAECGNGVREGTEECDATQGCNEECRLSETAEQLDCLERFADDDCLRCTCISCTQQAFDCFESGDGTRDMHCSAINQCARDNNCASTPCYCGTSPTCLFPNGPCVTEIHAAAPTPDPVAVDTDAMNPNTAIGRADLLARCELTNCPDVCP